MPRRRHLTEDEAALWRRVARSARRLQPAPDPQADVRPGPVPDPDAAPPAARRRMPVPPPVSPAVLPPVPPAVPPAVSTPPAARITTDLATPVGSELARAPVRMDRNAHARMMRGKLAPEARIDLHGMTLAQAHPALTGFVMHAHARGLRLILVITGKGRTRPDDDQGPMPRRAGALKHEVPQWLRSGPLRPLVLEVREAHHSHGGTGAYYVYLKRRR